MIPHTTDFISLSITLRHHLQISIETRGEDVFILKSAKSFCQASCREPVKSSKIALTHKQVFLKERSDFPFSVMNFAHDQKFKILSWGNDKMQKIEICRIAISNELVLSKRNQLLYASLTMTKLPMLLKNANYWLKLTY